MRIRRVVTGHTDEGKATVVSDAEVDATTIDLLPGADTALRGSGAPGFHGRTASDLAEQGGLNDLAAHIARPRTG